MRTRRTARDRVSLRSRRISSYGDDRPRFAREIIRIGKKPHLVGAFFLTGTDWLVSRTEFGQGQIHPSHVTSSGVSMAWGLVAAPTWTGMPTKCSQKVKDLGPGAGAAPSAANSRKSRSRPSAETSI